MRIVLFPGSFKPPHLGHLKIVETIMKKYKPDSLYIIISNKPRIIEEPFNKKLSEFSPIELEKLAKKYKINPDKKSIDQAIKDNIIPSISPNLSLTFWKKFIENIPNNDKIKISISFLPSPILTAFTIAKNKKLTHNDELLLVKSEKDQHNKRFSMFDAIDAKKEEIIIPTFKDFNSWQIRKAIYNKDWKKVKEFIPKDPEYVRSLKKTISFPS